MVIRADLMGLPQNFLNHLTPKPLPYPAMRKGCRTVRWLILVFLLFSFLGWYSRFVDPFRIVVNYIFRSCDC